MRKIIQHDEDDGETWGRIVEYSPPRWTFESVPKIYAGCKATRATEVLSATSTVADRVCLVPATCIVHSRGVGGIDHEPAHISFNR